MLIGNQIFNSSWDIFQICALYVQNSQSIVYVLEWSSFNPFMPRDLFDECRLDLSYFWK